MNVKEILSRQPPAVLYHYTTQGGLLGIVGTQEIWASHTQYLNDTREYRHAIDIVKEELANMEAEDRAGDEIRLLADMQKALVGIEDINVCVCSFSANGDLLSQWRAYAERMSGFSIGFSGPFLRTISESLKFWLVPVLYRENDQRHLVRTLLEDVLAENVQKAAIPDPKGKSRRPLGGNLVAYLNRYAPVLKHRSFEEEQEWRIISRPLPCGLERFDYRVGASMLIPYYRVPLSSTAQPFRIEEVIVGPTPNPQRSIHSVMSLLVKHELLETSVRISEVRYRNW
jgi:hypothetical protein